MADKETGHENEMSFESALENYLNPDFGDLEEGSITKGEIVRVDDDNVLVDVNFKSEGQIPASEFRDAAGNMTVSVGDRVDVYVVRKNEMEGTITLSFEKAKRMQVFDQLEDVQENNRVIKGHIVRRIKGGYTVDIGGVEAFLPGSHVDLRPVPDMDALVNQEFEFRVLKINRRRSNVIVSRRVLLEEERDSKRQDLLRTLEEGQIVHGKAKNITEYGVFVDLGGLDGLLHITDMSWKRIRHPKEMITMGQDLTLKVLSFDRENNKVSLGLKQLVPDPWQDISARFPEGAKCTGKVTNLVDYGAFVELEPGVEGLVHISEMSWTRKLRHPSQMVHTGDEVEVVILGVDGEKKRIRLTRIHMEEDAAKMVHVGGAEGRITAAAESLVDYNRCGTPLIELVTEPDLRTPEEARLFMEKLRRIFVTLGISDCSMEKGSMRCDGNVSLRRRGETKLGTKTELKNLNSFKSLHDGLAYEICRQAEVLEEGGIIYQETRHWEPSRKRTVVMRVKETADDYRLFPDPDLAPFDLDDEFIDRCRGEIPELPDAKCDRFEADFGIKAADAEQIAGDPEFADFFEAAAAGMAGKEAQTVANLLVNEMIAYLKGAGVSLAESGIAPAQVAALAKLLATDAISSNQAHEVFEAMAQTGDDPNKIVDERGMRQVSDAGALQPIVDEVLANCADQAQQYHDGNQKVIGFLVGQCMKASRGKGNPKLFNELLRTSLS